MVVNNDVLLVRVLYSLLGTMALEFFYRIFFDGEHGDGEETSYILSAKRKVGSRISTVIMSPPVHTGPIKRDQCIEDFLAGSRHIPKHRRRLRVMHQINKSVSTETAQPMMSKDQIGNRDKVIEKRLALLPKLPNCEPDGRIAQEMRRLFPDESIVDVVRFLVARKGNIDQAVVMMKSAVDWHSCNFPSRKLEIVPALKTGCFFSHGKALDGTPILFMRGAFYSSKIATPQQYVLAAAYLIDTVLAQSDQISVTVLVHACGIKGAPNESADINFIKLFVQVLSDNYPERLKRLVIYPFPWFARAMWGVIKMFVDKRTQDKVVLIPGQANGYPPDLAKYVDPRETPVCCGGTNTDPIFDMVNTIEDCRNDNEPADDFSKFWNPDASPRDQEQGKSPRRKSMPHEKADRKTGQDTYHRDDSSDQNLSRKIDSKNMEESIRTNRDET